MLKVIWLWPNAVWAEQLYCDVCDLPIHSAFEAVLGWNAEENTEQVTLRGSRDVGHQTLMCHRGNCWDAARLKARGKDFKWASLESALVNLLYNSGIKHGDQLNEIRKNNELLIEEGAEHGKNFHHC